MKLNDIYYVKFHDEARGGLGGPPPTGLKKHAPAQEHFVV